MLVVGKELGLAEGSGVGTELGAEEGALLGDELGLSEGEALGLVEGALLGEDVGLLEGEELGPGVGALLGEEVGLLVGDCVVGAGRQASQLLGSGRHSRPGQHLLGDLAQPVHRFLHFFARPSSNHPTPSWWLQVKQESLVGPHHPMQLL